MRVTVLGATGGVGTQVCRQALDAGHEVVAVVRDRSRLAVPDHDRLRVVVTGRLDAEAVRPAVDGADAVVSALGARTRGPTRVCTDGAAAAVEAMRATGVRRIVAVSASGAYVDDGDGAFSRWLVKPLLDRVFREGYRDTRRADDLLRASDRDWTLIRPPRLLNRPRRAYRSALDRNVGSRVGRADVADAILAALADPATVGHTVGIGY